MPFDPTLLITIAIVLLLGVGFMTMVTRFYRKVDQGKALIVSKMSGEPQVTFIGGLVLPIVYRAEVMDISVKTIEISRDGKEGLICADNIRADIKVTFFVRINKTTEDVLKVAQSIGCARASDQSTLEELFVAKFSEALKTVGKKLEFEQLYTQRDDFKDDIINVIGRDLNGYVLDDAAIDYLEQTPLVALDKDNILDAQGIRKITRITAEQHQQTNELRQKERMELTRQNLEADEAILELERRRADAEAKQHREIATVKARESAETLKVESEERQRAELARIKADEEIAINELNKQRQVEVAEKDRERVVAIKTEQVERDRDLEMISREREVERQRIDKEMELEVKRKEIADVVRSRVVVDKGVAEEEERIKDLRVTAEANRNKDVVVIAAQGEAEQDLVKEIKAAEAAEKVAEFKAREKLTMANAELESSDRVAKAKIRIAEGVQAEEAAMGLAEVRVKEANAVAIEKEGLAQARVEQEQGMARMNIREKEIELEAQLAREKMVAEADGKQAEAVATQKMGEAEAEAIRALKLAEAEGDRAQAAALKDQLLAKAAGTEAEGKAEATAVRERMAAEAEGLAKKLEAMQAMEGAAREHEEFRIRLAHERELGLQALEAQKAIASSQAELMSEAFTSADIKIMGGDGQFLDKFVQAASVGSAVDGFLENSGAMQKLLSTGATGAIGGKVMDALSGASKPQSTLDALKARLAAASNDEERTSLQALVAKAEELGL